MKNDAVKYEVFIKQCLCAILDISEITSAGKLLFLLERPSAECRKTKFKVTTLANHNRDGQSN